MVIQDAIAKAPPILSIISFHDKRIITGTNNVSTTDLRLRHWVLRSARNKDFNTIDVVGIVVSINKFYTRTARPVKPMNTSSKVILPFLDTAITSGSSRCCSTNVWGTSMAIIFP
jgi:hypothetical protein